MSETTEDVKVRVDERDDGTAVFDFPAEGFAITLKELNWGLFEDVDRIQSAAGNEQLKAMVAFFNSYVVGGAKAVPLKHTTTAMSAVGAYMDFVGSSQKKQE